MKRNCVCCKKEQPLNKKHFQVVKSFKDGYSYCCLTCDKENKKVKPQKKEEKFLKEKLEVKIQHRDLVELITILGYYKGMLESSIDEEIPTGILIGCWRKFITNLKNIMRRYEKLGLYISSTT
jgi:hypothetical protein